MERPSFVITKLLLGTVIAAVLISAGIFVGQKYDTKESPLNPTPTPTPQVISTPVPTISITPSASPSPRLSPSPSSSPTASISGTIIIR